MKNIHISEKTDAKLEQAEGTFKYWIIAFVLIAWFCRDTTYIAPHVVEMPTTSLTILGWIVF